MSEAMSAVVGAPAHRRARLDWRQPLLSIAAMLLTLLIVAAVHPVRGALVLGATLALSLSRSRLIAGWRGRAEALLTLPLVALATNGVAVLLKLWPPAGAAAYVAALFLSVWLRRFGPAWSRIGGLIALPFITLLIVPGAGAGTSRLGAMLLGLLALLVVIALRLAAEAAGLVPRAPAAAPPPPARASSLKPIASTRMAIQLALALLAAFSCAWLLFPGHRTWVVLAALLVCVGNRGRADVLHKSGLRILGVAAGTVSVALAAAVVPAGQPLLQGPALAALLLGIIAAGLCLRPWSYAAWACAVTLVVALLQNSAEPQASADLLRQLWQRVLATLAGAACGLGASWMVLPVRSEPVLRLRLAEVLALLGEWLAQPGPELEHRLDAALERLDEVAPPWRAWARLMPWSEAARRRDHWLRVTHACVVLARTGAVTAPVRRALGEARRALREPAQLGAALEALHQVLSQPATVAEAPARARP